MNKVVWNSANRCRGIKLGAASVELDKRNLESEYREEQNPSISMSAAAFRGTEEAKQQRKKQRTLK